MNMPISMLDYVLVRNSDDEKWRLGQYTHFEDGCIAVLGGNVFSQWKPYRNSRRLLGTADHEWHRGFAFKTGDRVTLENSAMAGEIAAVFEDERLKGRPYRVNWDNGGFGFYDEDELDPEK